MTGGIQDLSVSELSYFLTPRRILPPVLGDIRSLEQVFTNLISNSVEAMGETGGTLGVRLQRVAKNTKKTWIEISISDNGHGIPDELKDRIFEPFVTTSPRGTGLGLAITKSIITAHRGSINLKLLPRWNSISNPSLISRGREILMSITVLIVDDEENARLFIGEFLTSEGYETLTAGTLKEAREKISQGDCDIILLDVQLPDGYGPHLLDEISSLFYRPLIIIITAHGDIEMAVEAMKKGAHDFLTKPIELISTEVIRKKSRGNYFHAEGTCSFQGIPATGS